MTVQTPDDRSSPTDGTATSEVSAAREGTDSYSEAVPSQAPVGWSHSQRDSICAAGGSSGAAGFLTC